MPIEFKVRYSYFDYCVQIENAGDFNAVYLPCLHHQCGFR